MITMFAMLAAAPLAPIALIAVLAAAVMAFFVLGVGKGGTPALPGETFREMYQGLSIYTAPGRWIVKSGQTPLAMGIPPAGTDGVAAARAWIESISPSAPIVTGGEMPKAKPSGAPVPAPTTNVPDVIAQGGAPLPAGFEPFAWYSYRGRWIRVDLGPRPTNDPQLRVASDLPEGFPAMHYAKYFRKWQWSVMAGESPTPLASHITVAPFEVSSFGGYPDEQEALDEISDMVARLGGDWIDVVTGGA